MLCQLLAEGEYLDRLAGDGTLGRAQEVFQRDAGNLLRGLEGEEHAKPGTHIGGLVGHVLPTEKDLAAGHSITGVAHQGAHQGGFAGTVVAHQNMGLAGADG